MSKPQRTASTATFLGKLSRVTPGQLVLVHVDVKNSLTTCARIVREYQEQGYKGVYITLFKGYTELEEAFAQAGVNVSALACIDGITELEGAAKVKTTRANIIYVPSPFFLDEILEQLQTLLGRIKGKKRFVILDSLTAALLYNPLDKVLDFLARLAKLLEKLGVGLMVYVTVGPHDPEWTDALKKAVDAEIDLRGWQ